MISKNYKKLPYGITNFESLMTGLVLAVITNGGKLPARYVIHTVGRVKGKISEYVEALQPVFEVKKDAPTFVALQTFMEGGKQIIFRKCFAV